MIKLTFKVLLVQAGLTQGKLARKIGTSQQKVSRWARGSQPEYYYLPLLVTALGVDMETVVRSFLA